MDPVPKEFSDPGWVNDLAPLGVRSEGLRILEARGVADGAWNPPCLEGIVEEGDQLVSVRVNLKSRTFVSVECECGRGKGNRFCPHAMALVYAFGAVRGPQPDPKPLSGDRKSPPERGSNRPPRLERPPDPLRKEPDRTEGPQVDGTRHYLAVQLPPRGHPAYSGIRSFLDRNGFKLEPSNQKWWLRGEDRVDRFLATEGAALWTAGWDTRFTAHFEERFGPVVVAELKIETDPQENRVSGSWEIPGVDRETADSLSRSGRPMVRTDHGWVLFQSEDRERAQRLMGALGAGPAPGGGFSIRLPRSRIPGAIDWIERISPQTETPEEWRARYGRLRDPGSLDLPKIPANVRSRLRPYQLTGVAWLYHLANSGLAGVLADEMGLGKTVQALIAVEAWLRKGADATGRGLIVAPAALLQNWQREAERFVPNLSVWIHHGAGRESSPEALIANRHLIVTSYETLARDAALFREIEWEIVVADEAQQVRNRKTRRAKALAGLAANCRFVLTGTPIENSVEDLFSLFGFLLPGLFGTGVTRVRESGMDPEAILAATRPFILRRCKREVAPDLPERIEMEIPCSFPDRQETLYRTVYEKLEGALAGATSGNSAARMRIFAELTRLRQICAEPRVIDPSMQREDSGKAMVLRELIDEITSAGSRALLFSQFTQVLRMVESDLADDGRRTLYLDGSTRDRQALCDRFNEDPGIDAFLISIMAGGTGLNLTGADTVILLDPWWNPAVEAQAIDRAHRIGQNRTVTAIRLIAPDTIEDRVRALQREKGTLLEQLFAEGGEPSAIGLF